ncbi:carbohydrate-binding module family 13 protein [Cristinia sonorae]|uniref:Carbohydrate-binding module family 13 protein n=1 Tax=Cristinia sonorae TaxID=1940300 RepID=A0A8K0UW40_9AGAR|nr:carbohydrate-binding module family 13 protein [Cristinia sonorae]
MSAVGIQSGAVYRLVNAKAGNVLDLSGGDNESIIGYDWHGGDNQKWELQDVGDNEWVFRNVGTGKYLHIDSYAKNGTPVIASESKTGFNIWPDEEDASTYRVFVPNTRLNFDLSDHGNPTPGTVSFGRLSRIERVIDLGAFVQLITLWDKWSGRNQCWRFEQV